MPISNKIFLRSSISKIILLCILIYVYSITNIKNEQIYSYLKLLNKLFDKKLFACLLLVFAQEKAASSATVDTVILFHATSAKHLPGFTLINSSIK